MKYCSYCKVLNEEDSKVCKICGRKLDNISKTVIRTKVKKVKPKTKYKTKYKTVSRDKEKSNFLGKFMIFILINLCIVLIGLCAYMGYYIYKSENIKVPNVIGYNYDEAKNLLNENKLECQKVEKTVTDSDKVGIVLDQSKKGMAKENQTVILYVGVLDDKVIVPELTGMDLDSAIQMLDKLELKYKIIYKESDDENIIITQGIKEGTKIDKGKSITLTVSKKSYKKIEKTDVEITEEETWKE